MATPSQRSLIPLPPTNETRSKVVPTVVRRSSSPRISIPEAEGDAEAIRTFMRECMVPIMARRFLQERRGESEDSTEVNSRKLATGAGGKEDGL